MIHKKFSTESAGGLGIIRGENKGYTKSLGSKKKVKGAKVGLSPVSFHAMKPIILDKGGRELFLFCSETVEEKYTRRQD
jgi:hypothetical protein